MPRRASGRPLLFASCVLLLGLVVACNSSPTVPTPVQQTANFTGTLEPGGLDFKTFAITYTFSPTDLSVTITSLVTVADATPVTGPIGVGFGVVSGTTCVMQIFNPDAPLAQELFVPNGANAGSYCVQIFDCLPTAETCDPRLPEPVTYSMTVRHF